MTSGFDEAMWRLRSSLVELRPEDRRHYATMADKLDAMELLLRAWNKTEHMDAH